ncbi:MAG TPA: hypothetical protein VFC63_01935 [Blastocatellia bacterium]|nr:hypothetical protein [Blastocatellia bacterium]
MKKSKIIDKCEYCGSPVDESSSGRCAQCGGQIAIKQRNYTVCPYCKRKLLALASIACNYCGKGLPEEYIRTRQAVAQTIAEQSKCSPENDAALLKDEAGMMSWLSTVSDIIKTLDR